MKSRRFFLKTTRRVGRRRATRTIEATGTKSLSCEAKSSKDSSGYGGISSPEVVRVEKEYSATVEPASLEAVKKSVYHLAGTKSVIIKFPASGRT